MEDPSDHEAVFVLAVSLLASSLFWVASLVDSYQSSSSTIVLTALESFVDLVSTASVLWHIWHRAAYLSQPAVVHLREARTTVFVSMSMIALGVILIVLTVLRLAIWEETHPSRKDLTVEVAYTILSGCLYLVLAILQFDIGWHMKLRSVTLCGISTVLVAVANLGILLGALVNLLTCSQYALARYQEIPLLRGRSRRVPILHDDYKYPYYWAEDAISLVVALLFLLYGAWELDSDIRDGLRWYTPDFWMPSVPRTDSFVELLYSVNMRSFLFLRVAGSEQEQTRSLRRPADEKTPLRSAHG